MVSASSELDRARDPSGPVDKSQGHDRRSPQQASAAAQRAGVAPAVGRSAAPPQPSTPCTGGCRRAGSGRATAGWRVAASPRASGSYGMVAPAPAADLEAARRTLRGTAHINQHKHHPGPVFHLREGRHQGRSLLGRIPVGPGHQAHHVAGPGHLAQVDLPVADTPVGDHQIVEPRDRRHLLEPRTGACRELVTGQVESNQTGTGHRQPGPGISRVAGCARRCSLRGP